uniref:Uncharacterized protein n=1 Tax=Lepeophtheirus salmonis TaxID=72036 RepID=A0A0K2T7N2_LEPSM
MNIKTKKLQLVQCSYTSCNSYTTYCGPGAKALQVTHCNYLFLYRKECFYVSYLIHFTNINFQTASFPKPIWNTEF